MSLSNDFVINRYEFNSNLFNEFQNLHSVKDLWPIVYVLSDDKKLNGGKIKDAYVGETTDAFARMSNHLKNDEKNKLTSVHIITSETFNKSATLDIESNLIKYMHGDGQYNLLNGNLGLANHNYYQKPEYWNIFKSIWDKLRSEGIAKHDISFINNSDLFKYSPYKSLTPEQKLGLLGIINGLLNNDYKNFIVEGGAGTGKTILAIFLFKLLNTNNEDFNFKEFGDDEAEFYQKIKKLKDKFKSPNMALVVPMSSFRKTLQKVFKTIKGLKATMVIGPSELAKGKYDIVLVDESHRLRRRVNLTNYKSFDDTCIKLGLDKNNCNELDWVLMQSENAILFYDENQSIKPTDVQKVDFDILKEKSNTQIQYLKSQFRVKGGNAYVKFIDDLLNVKANGRFSSKDYEFILFDSIEDLIKEIKLRNDESGLSRLVAGYSWEWISSKDKKLFDIKIENTSLQWNKEPIDWINSDNSIDEVGCIHTTQGYDLNYTGVIFGNEIIYDKDKDEIVILKENYFDSSGKNTIRDPEILKEYIINIYKTIMLRGIKGTYVYVCDKNLREYFAKHISNYKIEKSISYIPASKVIPFINSIPLYNLKAAAGAFSEVQDVNDFEWIELPPQYKPSKELFACTVIGESMNRVIPNGSICLFRKYAGGSRNGMIVLAEHTKFQESEFGSRYTVKEYHSKKEVKEESWKHHKITFKPLSYLELDNIELSNDEASTLNIIGVFECVLS
jgi:DUF2075 family protein